MIKQNFKRRKRKSWLEVKFISNGFTQYDMIFRFLVHQPLSASID